MELDDFDVLMLRADPAVDAAESSWANTAGLAFGHLLADTGVLVVNDPRSLADAMSKAYFQHFPEVVRPRTMISRDEERVRQFIEELGGRAVLKPLQGSGGSGVFLVNMKEEPNITQIVEAIARDGYVVAQEYLPAAKDGDVRMFVMNGRALEVDGVYAAFRRRPGETDVRSNMSAGGSAEAVKVTDEMLQLVEAVRPKLLADGMFLVGLDIVGDKLMEVNVFSPGGLGSCASAVRRGLHDRRHRGPGAQDGDPRALRLGAAEHPARDDVTAWCTQARMRGRRRHDCGLRVDLSRAYGVGGLAGDPVRRLAFRIGWLTRLVAGVPPYRASVTWPAGRPAGAPLVPERHRGRGGHRRGEIGRILELPVEVPLARVQRARVAASHGHDGIGGAHDIVGQRLGELLRDIECRVRRARRDHRKDALAGLRAGRAHMDAVAGEVACERGSHL